MSGKTQVLYVYHLKNNLRDMKHTYCCSYVFYIAFMFEWSRALWIIQDDACQHVCFISEGLNRNDRRENICQQYNDRFNFTMYI